MNTHVLREVIRTSKCLATFAAGEGLLLCVDTKMQLQGAILREALATLLALEGLLARMRAQVLSQLPRAVKAFATLTAMLRDHLPYARHC